MKTMNDLFMHFLQDIYYAEKAAAKSTTKLLRSVENEQVREMLRNAKDNADAPIERLDRVFEAVGKRPRGKACEAMNGLLTEAQEAIEEGEKGPVLDAALIACLQGVKCYEMTRYGSLMAFARQMGLDDAVEELAALRDAARADDRKLTEIAEGAVNVEADEETGGEDDEEDDDGEDETPDGEDPTKKAAAPKPAPKNGSKSAKR